MIFLERRTLQFYRPLRLPLKAQEQRNLRRINIENGMKNKAHRPFGGEPYGSSEK